MAQLGDLARAKTLLRSAARGFGAKEPLASARCVVAEAEVAFASRELGWDEDALHAARVLLEKHGDRANAAHARYLAVRRLLLIGRMDEAERGLSKLTRRHYRRRCATTHELIVAGIAMRRLRTEAARKALARAMRAAREARIPALDGGGRERGAAARDTGRAADQRAASSARCCSSRSRRCSSPRRSSSTRAAMSCAHEDKVVSLAKRPVLFTLARLLAETLAGRRGPGHARRARVSTEARR